MFSSIKGPLLAGAVSAVCAVAISLLWLNFPSAVPIVLFMTVGLVGAVTFVICETIVALRLAKTFVPPRPLYGVVQHLPRRAFVGLAATLIACNGALLYFYKLRPSVGCALAFNLAIVVLWLVARTAVARYSAQKAGRRAQ